MKRLTVLAVLLVMAGQQTSEAAQSNATRLENPTVYDIPIGATFSDVLGILSSKLDQYEFLEAVSGRYMESSMIDPGGARMIIDRNVRVPWSTTEKGWNLRIAHRPTVGGLHSVYVDFKSVSETYVVYSVGVKHTDRGRNLSLEAALDAATKKYGPPEKEYDEAVSLFTWTSETELGRGQIWLFTGFVEEGVYSVMHFVTEGEDGRMMEQALMEEVVNVRPANDVGGVSSQVQEGLNLAGAAKVAILEFYQSTGRFPMDNAEAGLAEASSIRGKYVNSVRIVAPNGMIIITYRTKAAREIAGQAIYFVPLDWYSSASIKSGPRRWSCYSDLSIRSYVPSACKKQPPEKMRSTRAKFKIGDTIQVTGLLNIRATAGGTIHGVQTARITGTVIGGPIATNGFVYWNIDYTTGPDGWSAESWLVKTTASIQRDE